MRKRSWPVLLAVLLLSAGGAAFGKEDYKLGPDSMRQPGVPQGEVTHSTFSSNGIFPGTVRDYWVYVPKQYDAAKPACVMVFQDGGGFQDVNGEWRVPVVFDNLIHKGEMPVTIAIMVNPGIVPARSDKSLPRYNRSHEYDAPTGDYARFLETELLPEVGKKFNLTTDPNGRALCGASSGGICAFVAAWERPDLFHRVYSAVGSFTNLQGGHVLPSLIRKTEPKPIRVFMQEGSNDQDIYSGSWPLGNQDIAAALRYAGYEYQLVMGDGPHSGKHGGVLLPDALRFLWKDYPKPVAVPTNDRQPVQKILIPGEGWEKVGALDRNEVCGGLTADAGGNVYYAAESVTDIKRLGVDGTTTDFKEKVEIVGGLAFGPDGRLYVGLPAKRRIVAFDANKKESLIIAETDGRAFTINHEGDIFYSNAGRWHTARFTGGKARRIDSPLAAENPAAFTLTPDQTLLMASLPAEKYVLSTQVQEDGKLDHFQEFFDVHIAYNETKSGASGMVTDTQGWLYVATPMGVQICDQAGRVNSILLTPGFRPVTHLVFGGPNRDYLFAFAGDTLYRRHTRAKGVYAFEAPIKPPQPRL